jgi:hypothetical protein
MLGNSRPANWQAARDIANWHGRGAQQGKDIAPRLMA